MINITCPDCGNEFAISDRSAGQEVRCDVCQYVFVAPDSPTEAAEDRMEWERQRNRPPRRSRRDDYRPPPKKRFRNSNTFVFLVVAGVMFLMCGGFCLFSYIAFVHEIDEPVAQADKDVVVTAEHVSQFVDNLKYDKDRGKFSKVRHLDGSKEMSYEYEAAEGDQEGLYVNCIVGITNSPTEARDAYGGLKLGTKIGMSAAQDLTEVERNDLWSWGDDSRCVLLQNGGKSVGNIFMGRKGKRYFALFLVGVYFDKKDDIKEFLDAILKKIESYDG